VSDSSESKHSCDALSVDLTEDILPPTQLTDLLIRVCRRTLEKNRMMIDSNVDIRSLTITVKLSDQGRIPYKVFLTPTHESHLDK
jgi:hypothetical protein